jgi:phosphoribosylaminoimidazolecarboxamide formyltransferase / IMP cyclohydrolase
VTGTTWKTTGEPDHAKKRARGRVPGPEGKNVKRAILSVSDKTGLEAFARGLIERGFELISTGGTFKTLKDAGLNVTYISDVTGFPEILEGRVKTLHPNVHGGILAKRTPDHLAQLEAQQIKPVDLVCVNLYPFRETVAKPGVSLDDALENIDIGGPTMVRASAKNFPNVIVVVDPNDYDSVLQSIDLESQENAGGRAEHALERRQKLAAKAFAHASSYDAAITDYLRIATPFDSEIPVGLSQKAQLRYGENPHQNAALTRAGGQRGPILDAKVLAGKEMGFNNYADADAAWALVSEFKTPTCVAVKHANPCGVASASDAKTAWEKARDADTLSVFGGVIAINRPVTLEVAMAMKGTFLEVLIAPEIASEALEWFQTKKPDLRVLEVGPQNDSHLEYKQIAGGFLVQDRDARAWEDLCPEVVTKTQPTPEQWADLEFAWKVGKHARSNNIVLAKNGETVGLGSGAVSRIWAAERAIANSGDRAGGAVLSSEAFFPFDDVARVAANAGVKAIIQPGGAKRDAEVIAACDELGVAMVFTGSRHFKH